MAKERDIFNRHPHDDPWDLPACFLQRKNDKWKSQWTYSGYWKEKQEELTAIRFAGESSSSSSSSASSPPSYVGVRKTLEFYLRDGTSGGEGTKTDWTIHEYYDLRKDGAGAALVLEEDVVLRKVFNKRKNRTDQESFLHRLVESFAGRKTIKLYRHSGGAQLNENLGDGDCDPDAKSDNVWKHFTKICSTNDPDEVYAACHRCDKVLKAHSKKHGTSSLRRHFRTCSSCTNPSTDEDREMLHHLRTYREQQTDDKFQWEEINGDIAQLDPRGLNRNLAHPWYVTRSSNRQTQGGHWKEIDKNFTAIRMDQQGGCWEDIDKEITVIQMEHQLQVQVPKPQYMGLRRTLQFHHQDGSKVDRNWIMFEYQQLDDMGLPALLLQGCMVIRKVFWYDKDVVASAFSELDRVLNADDGDEEYFSGDGVNTDVTMPCDNNTMDTSCSVFPLDEGMNTDTTTSRKRKRTKSEVWMHFTKICNKDRGVVYVVCHTCDRGYSSGRSTNGTSHLRRHHKSCTNKRPRTGAANDATAEWDAEIWPLFLLLKNYGEHQPSGMC